MVVARVVRNEFPGDKLADLEVQDDLIAAAGFPAVKLPEFVHFSPGVDVEVFPLAPVAGSLSKVSA